MIVKGVNIPNDWIDEMTAKLDISIDEAIELYLTDIGAEENEEQNALHEKAKGVKIDHNAGGKPKKKVVRERKPNELKREIINTLIEALSVCEIKGIEDTQGYFNSLTVRNSEKYIDFTIDGREFTINLVEHRPPKEKKKQFERGRKSSFILKCLVVNLILPIS